MDATPKNSKPTPQIGRSYCKSCGQRIGSKHCVCGPENFCLDCKEHVMRCYEQEGMCNGGGHCEECGGNNFKGETTAEAPAVPNARNE